MVAYYLLWSTEAKVKRLIKVGVPNLPRTKQYLSGTQKRTIDIDKELNDFLSVNFPNYAISAIVQMLLKDFKDRYEDSKTPRQISKIVAKRMVREME